MVIKWTKPAVQDLKDFKLHTLMTSKNSKRYISDLYQSVDVLSNSPFLGKEIFIINKISIRQFIFRKHRILYYINDNTIVIVAVVHTSRNFGKFTKKYLSDFYV